MLTDPAIEELPTQDERQFRVNIDPRVEESLQGGLDAVGKVFDGLVGAIKEAVGPELMRNMETANCLGQLATCLEAMAEGLNETGTIPAAAAGRFAFFVGQFDGALEGSKLAAQETVFRQQLNQTQQAVANANGDPTGTATVLAKAAGYFKAAAASCLPLPHGQHPVSRDA